MFTDPAVPGLIRRANIRTLEFNGGPVSDLYHWRTGTAQADPDADVHPDYTSIPPQFSFDQFEKTARATAARTLVHVNYGTGTPAEAAAWVRYAKQRHDHVSGWAIGEEVWGNGGIPSIDFEPDAHADKSPQAYGRNALAFIAAMKKADPSARVGVELLGVPGGAFQAWDEAVMAIVGTRADFVDIHAYPFGLADTSDASVLAFPRTDAAQDGRDPPAGEPVRLGPHRHRGRRDEFGRRAHRAADRAGQRALSGRRHAQPARRRSDQCGLVGAAQRRMGRLSRVRPRPAVHWGLQRRQHELRTAGPDRRSGPTGRCDWSGRWPGTAARWCR